MTKQVTPHVFLIAKTGINDNQARQWLDHIGAMDFTLPNDTSPGTALTTLAGKQCYMSFQVGLNPNITKIRQDLTSFIYNILSSGHGSVLEHTNYTFALEGISRVFTAELNRHRAGVAISERSLRFCRFDDISYPIPLSIQDDPSDSEDIRDKKLQTRAIFEKAFRQDEELYKELCEVWGINDADTFKEKKELTSMFRRVVGMGVATGGVWTFNLRALRHILTVRSSQHAEEEICYVCSLILQQIINEEPQIFGDFYTENSYWLPKFGKV